MQAGIDEAGRGCLAGPVIAAAVVLHASIPELNDSKALSEKQRASLFHKVTQYSNWSYSVSSAREVDQINIRQATLKAMSKALVFLPVVPSLVLIDGQDTIETKIQQRAVIGGDRLVPEIMAASIIAKHIRDQLMYLLDMQYPQYQFAAHKGYGTKAHLAALAVHGLVRSVHRQTFKPCQVYA
ncbi:ribonuclease HII [Gammaproteobacteria bacterium]|nr:ribonuclease HII [Gammaproteobacteria bacterium]